MGPQGFKKLDKRHFHVKDMADVIEWFEYRASRDAEALKVIKSMRNGYNTQKSIIKSYQDRDQRNRNQLVSESEERLAPGVAGNLETVNEPSKEAQDEAILSELQEQLDVEKAEALARKSETALDEDGNVDTGEYSVFYVKDSPRFKKGNIMVKAADVPESIRDALTAEKSGGES